jgi:hypothetical protein
MYMNIELLDVDVWAGYADAKRAPTWLQLPLADRAFAELGATEVARSTAYVETTL